jgi:2-polyprenyl-3-methyl-5-hydroxy-6-metoxy-1,4-benzoquinol methylase
MSTHWNQRFSSAEYIYGTAPNAFFKQVIDGLKPGRLLVPGAGEGRDAVYAATLGWEVHAFDQSSEGRRKALLLAGKKNVQIRYELADAAVFACHKKSYDLIALVFVHFEPALRERFHRELVKCLHPCGLLLAEAFHKKQLGNSTGGPKDPEMLVTVEMLAKDFVGLAILENRELQVILNEGTHHIGPAEVVRFLGQKNQPNPSYLAKRSDG